MKFEHDGTVVEWAPAMGEVRILPSIEQEFVTIAWPDTGAQVQIKDGELHAVESGMRGTRNFVVRKGKTTLTRVELYG